MPSPLGGRWPEGPDEGAIPGNFRSIAPLISRFATASPRGKPFFAHLCNFTILQQVFFDELPRIYSIYTFSTYSEVKARMVEK